MTAENNALLRAWTKPSVVVVQRLLGSPRRPLVFVIIVFLLERNEPDNV